jgi:ABC-type transporter Mla subunit MlaD
MHAERLPIHRSTDSPINGFTTMSTDRSNFKAGLFVVGGLALAFAAIVMLSDFDGMFTPMQQVKVRFPLTDGLMGLKVGANVTIGNHPAGTVVLIEEEMQDDRVTAQLATLELPRRYKLYDNARVELVVPPLGAGTSMNIRNVGYDATSEQQQALVVQGSRVIRLDPQGNPLDIPDDLKQFTVEQLKAAGHVETVDAGGRIRLGESWKYATGETLRGGRAASQLMADLVREIGISDMQKLQIRRIIANVDTIMAALAEEPDKLASIVANVESITQTLKADMPSITRDAKEVMAQAKALANTANATVSGIQSIVVENSDDIRAMVAKGRTTMDNAESITHTLKTQTLAKIDEALNTAHAAIEHIKEATGELRTLAVAQRPVLERTIANARLVSDQLKLASIEIRRSPWRLLYKPTDKELDTDNVYDAARSFALAAGTLDSTAESLRTLLERHNGQLGAKQQHVADMLQSLHETFEKFDTAEKGFWKALGQKPLPKSAK